MKHTMDDKTGFELEGDMSDGTDLVSRLRNDLSLSPNWDRAEAACEIERLRKLTSMTVCATCGCKISPDEIPCRLDHGICPLTKLAHDANS
jgi:hypothetical protein